jgi:TonB-linked SusC/RagA family outer membrane protein
MKFFEYLFFCGSKKITRTNVHLFRTMKATVLMLITGACMLSAHEARSQGAKLTIHFSCKTIKEAISEIEKKSDYVFVWTNHADMETDRTVSLDMNDAGIEQILDRMFDDTQLSYRILGKQIVVYLDHAKKVTPKPETAVGPPARQQTRKISGTVIDSDGEPVIGANVLEKGTVNGAVTDLDGNFSLDVSDGAVLQISYIGYVTQEIAVHGRTVFQITLHEDAKLLEEVVVIGYGTVAKKDVTTAVSLVSMKDLDERPIVTAAQAIQGKAAGVNVYQPNGSPGAGMVIRVRGTTSFNGSNDPLYVVDGVPVDNLNFLSPNDISSLQILKDASSAAIYGSRAANGVVLITTRQAQAGAKIALSAQMGVNRVTNHIESLNAARYKELMDEIRPGAIPDGTVDRTDWFDEVYGTGITQNYQLQVSDGNDKLRYFVSGGYLDEKGVLNSAFFRRYNFRANIDNQVKKWLNINASISYSDNSSNGVTTGQGSNRGGVVLAVVNLPTSSTVKDETTGLYNRTFFGQNITNPIESIENGKNNRDRENRLIASGNATVTFLPELNLRSSFTLDRRNGISSGFTPPVHGVNRDDWGTAWDIRSTNSLLIFDNVLTFKKTFGRHLVEAMAGTSWTDANWSENYINGTHFKDASIHTLNAANKIAWDNTGSHATQWGIMSAFGRLAYNFDSKYLVTVNVREDGSSKLHPDHRWGTFPSLSAAWRMSSENFMQDVAWLDDLKIRAGWGQTGNQSGIGEYAYLQRYSISRQAWFETGKSDAVPLITQANLRTADLTWETTSQTNVGLDIMLLQNRLSIAMDYYYKHTADMLMYVSLPAGATAASSIVRNEGEMTNSGFELAANSRNFTGAFSWDTDFNISFNRNRLKSLELQQIYYDAETTDAFHQMRVVRNEPGRPLGGFFGYISDGVDPETGELMYRDINEDGKITASDKTYIGDPNPVFTYGLTNTFSYGRFNLNIFIQGSVGNDVFNASKGDTEGMYDLKNQSVNVLDRWRTPGQITSVPRAGFNLQPSSYFIEDGSYLRLKDISLSYNFAGESLKKMGVTRLQPYFTARNLLTLTRYKGMDPEVNQWGNSGAVQGIDWGTYPHAKSYVFGVNVEF